MGMPELLTDPRFVTNTDRVAHHEELDKIIDDWSSHYATAREVCKYLDGFGVPATPINYIDDIFKDEQMNYRESLKHVQHPVLGDVVDSGAAAQGLLGYALHHRPPWPRDGQLQRGCVRP